MNIETAQSILNPAPPGGGANLRKAGLEKLHLFAQQSGNLDAALTALAALGDGNIKKPLKNLSENLRQFEPTITVIGQVKAGKTSLLNAMIGWPDLLPADVNPWTSVVTSLHLDPRKPVNPTRAKFRLFNDQEWNSLLSKGGRLGELASRAGAGDELQKIQTQLETLREKSRVRLGRKFELLLGQEHEYSAFNQELIERYVCLGELAEDSSDPGLGDGQGRFADITKSADLYLHQPELPTRLCLRDTPGVNDTFMVREQMTIRAIRDSRLCVVVLSAHQALSSVDMALIRMITNIKTREIIIFVNRIDELPDPANQISEIRNSITQTLQAHNGPKNPAIVFGSAAWANLALKNGAELVLSPLQTSLLLRADLANTGPRNQLWHLSGIPALFDALSRRIVESSAQELLQSTAQRALNLANGLVTSPNAAMFPATSPENGQARAKAAQEILHALQTQTLSQFNADFQSLLHSFTARLDASHHSFLERATASLADHLAHKGEDVIWQYKPDGLRMMFNSAYAVFGKRAQTLSTTVFETAATQIAQSYGQTFGQTLNPDAILIPAAPRIPPAVFLGQTIALDLKGPWWKGWWNRRRGHDAFAQSFRALIEAETTPLMDQLKTDQTGIIKTALVRSLQAFFADQNAIAASWGTSPDPTAIDPQKTICPIIQTLQAFLAKPEKASTP